MRKLNCAKAALEISALIFPSKIKSPAFRKKLMRGKNNYRPVCSPLNLFKTLRGQQFCTIKSYPSNKIVFKNISTPKLD